MRTRHGLLLAVIALAGLLAAGAPAPAQGKKSSDVVKVSAAAEKADADGKQVVTLTLDVDPKYYIYANPVGNADFESNQTSVSAAGGAKVEYPAGEVVEDKVVGNFRIYKGKVTIKAVVQRGAGPLELAVKLQACSKSACLLPGTVKVTVP